MTIGLTIMIVPMIRSSRRKTGDAPEFLALHFQQIRPKPGIRTISTPEKVMEGSIASDLAKKARGISIESQPKPAQTIPIPAPTSARWDQITEDDLASTSLLKWRRFNTKEEREIFGTSLADPKSLEDEEDDWGDKSPDFDSHAREGGEDEFDHTLDQMDKSGWMNRLAFSPLATFYAFAISTAFVGVSTGLGVWIVAKALGVEDVRGFFFCVSILGIPLPGSCLDFLPSLSFCSILPFLGVVSTSLFEFCSSLPFLILVPPLSTSPRTEKSHYLSPLIDLNQPVLKTIIHKH